MKIEHYKKLSGIIGEVFDAAGLSSQIDKDIDVFGIGSAIRANSLGKTKPTQSRP